MTIHHTETPRTIRADGRAPRRFSEGLEHDARAASVRRVGRFSDGLDRRPHAARVGTYADGLSVAAPERVGSYADRFAA